MSPRPRSPTDLLRRRRIGGFEPPGAPGVWLVGWAVLAALLLATLIAAASFDRASFGPPSGEEATYAMQAASLVADLDLAYERRDLDRFVATWGGPPDGLILTRRASGGGLTFGKPWLWALASAPAVAVSASRGPAVAAALWLALAAVATARALRRRLGAVAPLWVAAFCFASVAFAAVFWNTADLFLMATVALGLALVYGAGEEGEAKQGCTDQQDSVTANS